MEWRSPFVLVALLTPIALAILLSHRTLFFESDAVAPKNRQSGALLERRQLRLIVLEASSERSATQCESISIEHRLMGM
jgi:hypothetical protein